MSDGALKVAVSLIYFPSIMPRYIMKVHRSISLLTEGIEISPWSLFVLDSPLPLRSGGKVLSNVSYCVAHNSRTIPFFESNGNF